MKLVDRQKMNYRYGSKLYSNETIDKVIELFYTLKDNRSSVIGDKVGLSGSQVLGILNRYDDNTKKFERERL